MHRTYTRIPTHFFRISLRSGIDQMTLALVPDQEHAHLIAHLLTKNYGLRKGENIVVHPTVIRPVDSNESTGVEISLG